MNSSMAESRRYGIVSGRVKSSNLFPSSKYLGELTEWYCSGPLSHHRLFGAKVRILYSPQKMKSAVVNCGRCLKCECDKAGELWRSVTPLPSGSISSNLITHTNGESPAGLGSCLENS